MRNNCSLLENRQELTVAGTIRRSAAVWEQTQVDAECPMHGRQGGCFVGIRDLTMKKANTFNVLANNIGGEGGIRTRVRLLT